MEASLPSANVKATIPLRSLGASEPRRLSLPSASDTINNVRAKIYLQCLPLRRCDTINNVKATIPPRSLPSASDTINNVKATIPPRSLGASEPRRLGLPSASGTIDNVKAKIQDFRTNPRRSGGRSGALR